MSILSCEHLSIGPTPAEESCEQLGQGYDPAKARAECIRFLDGIRRRFGNEPPGAFLHVHANQHDFGTYYEVCCKYLPGNEIAERYAFDIEGGCPGTWAELESPRG